MNVLYGGARRTSSHMSNIIRSKPFSSSGERVAAVPRSPPPPPEVRAWAHGTSVQEKLLGVYA